MSIEYQAVCGIGYYVSADETSSLSGEKFDDFTENEFCIDIDGWVDNTGYFFGITLQVANDGECKVISANNIDNNKYLQMIREFQFYFPNHKDVLPRYYLLHRVF